MDTTVHLRVKVHVMKHFQCVPPLRIGVQSAGDLGLHLEAQVCLCLGNKNTFGYRKFLVLAKM